MRKLIQTNFSYEAYGRIEHGSYLGRKRASASTLRRFIRKNALACGTSPREYKDIVITESFESQWIAK